MLLVNKWDLEEEIEIKEADLKRFSKIHGIPYIWTSAKSGMNVDDSFLKMTQSLIEKRDLEEENGERSKIGKKGKGKGGFESTNLFRSAEKAMKDKDVIGCCKD